MTNEFTILLSFFLLLSSIMINISLIIFFIIFFIQMKNKAGKKTSFENEKISLKKYGDIEQYLYNRGYKNFDKKNHIWVKKPIIFKIYLEIKNNKNYKMNAWWVYQNMFFGEIVYPLNGLFISIDRLILKRDVNKIMDIINDET